MMLERKYEVFMRTPLGMKKGVLLIRREGACLKGWLDILHHREPIEGSIDEEGNCKLGGTFITLLNIVSFTAVGKITDFYVDLHMEDRENRHFRMTGSAYGEAERGVEQK